jgi:predicted ATPase/DNA-binding SARP family transcriptional activator/DNA-binding CsgD family transcriptional regulator/transcriptional regulator with XRE-family HTH domain
VAGQPALSFAGLLRQLRVEAKLTQEELAEAASVSPRSVSDLERGINRTARKDTARLLAEALGLAGTVADLFAAAARGRVPARDVLAARRRVAPGGIPEAVARTLTGDATGFTGHQLSAYAGAGSDVVRVAMLGGFRVDVGGCPVLGTWRLRKSKTLVKLLALADGHGVHRDVLAEVLWPGMEAVVAVNNLHQVLHAARRALAPDGSPQAGVVSLQDDMVILSASGGLVVDAEVFAGAGQRALRSRSVEDYRATLDLYAGELLPGDRDADWAVAHRERLAALYDSLRTGLARAMLESGNPAEAVALLEPLAGSRPDDEVVRRLLIEAVDAQVLAATRGEAQGALRAAAGGVHGFLAPLTSFVGRAGAVRQVAVLLDQYRLVTVTGPGGVGKTRLAGVVASEVAGRFADGVWLAELAAVRDPEQAPAVIATAVGVRELPGESAGEALARVLARRQLLLVLDNCEHLIGAVAVLCAKLLPACDEVRILATGREPLRVAGEVRYRLGPLVLPDPDDLANATRAEAVALFADRARCVDPRFSVEGPAGLVVARLVRRLDGMPLAIELAAARVEALGVAQLLDRLDDRFALLTAGDRAAPARQRSLAATVAWSYQLLDEQERRVFRLISVFPGPFTLEAAEAVVGDDAGPVVLRLVDCSLVVPPQAGPDGRARYVMLETLRAYGAELLAQARELDGAWAALAGWALVVAEEAAAGLRTGTAEMAAARRLDAEDLTMQRVLAWAMRHNPAVALRLAVALAPWWKLRGRLAGQYSLLRGIADRAVPGSDQWCAAHVWLGRAAAESGDPAAALDYFTTVRDVIWDRGQSQALADCLDGRQVALVEIGRIAEAAQDARRCLALAGDLGYPAGHAGALLTLSIAASHVGDLRSAVRLACKAQRIPSGIPSWLAISCSYLLVGLLTDTGDLAAAERICAAGLARSRAAGDLAIQAPLLARMAILDVRAGRIEDAAAHLREALQIGTRTGGLFDLLSSLYSCGFLCAATGRHAEALTVWAAAAALGPEGFTDAPVHRHPQQEAICAARQSLGSARVRAAEARGTAMSRAAAAEYALMLTTPCPLAAAPGEGQLSAGERELVTLVAQGRTDTQIAARLDISVRTVSSRLGQIKDKTGCRRRADLTRLALSAGLV